MRWRTNLDNWHRIYCWMPFFVEGHWIWLEHIERRRTGEHLYDDTWEYRLPDEPTP